MKKIWCFLLSSILIIFNGNVIGCIAKIELTELFQPTKDIDITTQDVNYLVEMKLVNDINNKNVINLDSVDFNKVLNFFLKQGKNLDEYIIFNQRPSCYADSSLKNKKAIYVEIHRIKKDYDKQLSVEFHLNIYCAWKKTKKICGWEKTSLKKNITLVIKSDQALSYLLT